MRSFVLCTQSFPMVFLSPPNSNGLLLSTFQARTNPPLTRALASTWLLVGKAGWLASGTRGRLICQLRQFGPPLCGPPYRRPPAESSHGCYERRALFQELLLKISTYIYIYIYNLKMIFLLRGPSEEPAGRADDGEVRRVAARAGGAGR